MATAVTPCETGRGGGGGGGGDRRWHVAFTCSYRNETPAGATRRLTSRMPVAATDASYTLHPGLLHAGNPTAEAYRCLRGDFPDAASTAPRPRQATALPYIFGRRTPESGMPGLAGNQRVS